MTIQIIYNEYPLNYDSQTGSFTVGNIIYQRDTDGSVLAYATIRRIDRNGTAGTLYLQDITGTFQDNKVIYEATYESELLTNGTFAAWTGDDPDDWTVYFEDGSNYVTESAGKCRIVSDNSSAVQCNYLNILTAASFYITTLDCTDATLGNLNIYLHGGLAGAISAVQSYTLIGQCSGGTSFVMARGGACDVTVDNVSVKKITNAALANGTVQNPITIDLSLTRAGVNKTFMQERSMDRSYSGKTQIINQYGIQEMSFEAMYSVATYYKLLAWWSWARQGKLWAFTMDSSKIGNTTLDGGALAGQKTIPLTATTGFSATDVCLIKKADLDDAYEIVVIASVSAGVSVTATDNLQFNYASGDSFKHLDYWPEVVTLDDKFLPVRTNVNSTTGKYYRSTFKFAEAL